MHSIFHRFDRLARKSTRLEVVGAAVIGALIVGIVDYVTGHEVSLAVFYLGPISVAAWYADRRSGIAIAVLSCLCWYVAEQIGGAVYSHPLIPVWNALVRLGSYLIIALLIDALRRRLELESRLSRTDALTGVLNGRAFAEHLEYNLAAARRHGRPFTLAFVDLDDFKRVNDAYGHGEGNRVLCAAARTLSESLRETDKIARLGGDEFALLLPDTDAAGASAAIAHAHERLGHVLRAGARSVTCSVGAVTFHERQLGAEQAMNAADALMYAVKGQGKNAVAVGVYDATLGVAVTRSQESDMVLLERSG